VSFIEIIVLAVVQGLTEFIPISSTAHLRIVPALLGWRDPGAAFSAVIQIGTLVAVVTYFWRDIVGIAVAMFADVRTGRIASTHNALVGWMIVVATLPIVVCGVLFKDYIETALRSLYVCSAALAGVAALLGVAEVIIGRRRIVGIEGRGVDQITWRDAIVVGCMQAAALVPGTSRSGATILGGLMSGLSREASARFSFLLSIPAIGAAGVFQLIEAREEFQGEYFNLAIALIVTAIVGYATIPWLLAFLRQRSTFIFIAYRFLLAGLILALLASGTLAPY
jgi:undecaprenyl-diphosphatase